MPRALSLPFARYVRPNLRARLARMMAVRRERRALAALEPHRLCDLGLSAEEAAAEARRPFWDAPERWTR